ncbi:MAG: hypothetical protein PHD03_03680 [Bacilli bacterium]|nr:hypothetical protein [Bacilli bacterium]MDD4406620.1 hypothetical protein [Bacilli bacterium]
MYSLIKKKEKNKLLNRELSKNYLELKLNKKTIILNNQKLIDQLYLKEIMPKLDKVTQKILLYLNSDNDDEEQANLLYDDLAKLRSLILKKYEKFLSKEAIHMYMKNIRFIASELKKRLKTYDYEKVSNRTR